MARMTGFVFQDEYLERLAKLSDQELGRLVRALATYHATGEEQELAGRESIAYDFIKADIDRIDDHYEAKCETNRNNRQRSSTVDNDRQRSSTDGDEQQRTPTRNDKEKIKKSIIPPRSARAREDTPLGPVDLDPLILKLQQELNGMTDNHYQALNDYREQLGDDLVSHAVDEAVGNGVRNWTYVEKILARYLKEGIRDLGEAKASDERRKQDAPQQKPRLLRAQDYEQREYVEDEMKKILDVHALYR